MSVMLKNSTSGYGWISIAIHWLSALVIFGMFGLGLYMVDLTYYDDFYKTGPYIHKSIGILLALVMLGRLLWKVMGSKVAPLATHKSWEVRLAHVVHFLLYMIFFMIAVSGYLISSADGSSIEVFGIFEVPSAIDSIDNLEDIAGDVHECLAWLLIGLVVFHVLGAMKHHVIDKDNTLRRMLFSNEG